MIGCPDGKGAIDCYFSVPASNPCLLQNKIGISIKLKRRKELWPKDKNENKAKPQICRIKKARDVSYGQRTFRGVKISCGLVFIPFIVVS